MAGLGEALAQDMAADQLLGCVSHHDSCAEILRPHVLVVGGGACQS